MPFNRPLVSVIVPNYNFAASLERCLRAVHCQDYQPIELIMVDDGSTDNSVAIAEELGARVLRTDRNQGVSAARNLGAKQAAGDILMFIDSDVAIEPDAVEVAVEMLRQDPQIGAVCSIHDPEPLIRDSRLEEYRALQFHYWSASSEGSVSFLFSAMFAMRRAVFDEIGPFRTWLRHNEEVDYGHRLTQRYEIILSTALRSRHDHDSKLFPLMRKLFRRARDRVPLYMQRKRFARGFETSNRAGGSLAALVAVGSLPLVAIAGPVGLAVPAFGFALSLLADLGMYRFVLRRRGPVFLLYYIAVHLLVNVSIAAGVMAGLARWLYSGRFRRLYDAELGPKPTTPGGAETWLAGGAAR